MSRTTRRAALGAVCFILTLGLTVVFVLRGMHRTPLAIVPALSAGAALGIYLRMLYGARRSGELLGAWLIIAVLSAGLLWLAYTHDAARPDIAALQHLDAYQQDWLNGLAKHGPFEVFAVTRPSPDFDGGIPPRYPKDFHELVVRSGEATIILSPGVEPAVIYTTRDGTAFQFTGKLPGAPRRLMIWPTSGEHQGGILADANFDGVWDHQSKTGDLQPESH